LFGFGVLGVFGECWRPIRPSRLGVGIGRNDPGGGRVHPGGLGRGRGPAVWEGSASETRRWSSARNRSPGDRGARCPSPMPGLLSSRAVGGEHRSGPGSGIRAPLWVVRRSETPRRLQPPGEVDESTPYAGPGRAVRCEPGSAPNDPREGERRAKFTGLCGIGALGTPTIPAKAEVAVPQGFFGPGRRIRQNSGREGQGAGPSVLVGGDSKADGK